MCRNMAHENACQLEKICYNSKCKTDKYQNGTFQTGFPQGPVLPPKIVLHLPPPRVNGDNVITSCVLIRTLHYRCLLFYFVRNTINKLLFSGIVGWRPRRPVVGAAISRPPYTFQLGRIISAPTNARHRLRL